MKIKKFGTVLELPENIIVYLDYNTLELSLLVKVDEETYEQVQHEYFITKTSPMIGYFPYRGDKIVALMEKHMNAKVIDRWGGPDEPKETDREIVY